MKGETGQITTGEVEPISDRELLSRLCRKDMRAMEELLERYNAYVLTVIRGRTRNLLSPEDVEEAAADVFVTLWERAQTVAPEKLRPWLGAVARNKAKDKLRAARWEVLPLEEDVILVPDSMSETLELRDLADRMLSCLDDSDREIFIRYYDLCQTTEEIAGYLGMSRSAVKTRLQRGREKLRCEFEGGI